MMTHSARAPRFAAPPAPAAPRRRAARRGAPHPCQRGTCDGLSCGPPAHWGGDPRGRGWINASEKDSAPSEHCPYLAVHLVSDDRHFHFQASLTDVEHITGDGTFHRSGRILTHPRNPLELHGPLTTDPCCANSNLQDIPPEEPEIPCHVPVTSTVTSVRSIQSCLAQSECHVVAMRSP